jgi:hypothetical protein
MGGKMHTFRAVPRSRRAICFLDSPEELAHTAADISPDCRADRCGSRSRAAAPLILTQPSGTEVAMKRSIGTLAAFAAVFMLGACAPDDDQVQVQEAEEVHAPAPVMPLDTVMQDTMHMDHDAAHDTVPQG